jgi:hypothetical protein
VSASTSFAEWQTGVVRFSRTLGRRPVRYRSKATGRYVSEEFAREHPEETRAVNARLSRGLGLAVGAGLLAVAIAGGMYSRRRR